MAEGATSQKATVHVGALTVVFALMQFFFAPLWGKWSDKVGRRPLVLIGLGGYAFFRSGAPWAFCLALGAGLVRGIPSFALHGSRVMNLGPA